MAPHAVRIDALKDQDISSAAGAPASGGAGPSSRSPFFGVIRWRWVPFYQTTPVSVRCYGLTRLIWSDSDALSCEHICSRLADASKSGCIEGVGLSLYLCSVAKAISLSRNSCFATQSRNSRFALREGSLTQAKRGEIPPLRDAQSRSTKRPPIHTQCEDEA